MTDQTILNHAAEIGALKAEVGNMKSRLEEIDEKLDRIIAAANMGRGAWLVSLKAGGVLVTLGAGVAWVWNHVIAVIIPR